MKSLMDEWVDKGAHKWKREGMREGEKRNALKIAKRLRAKGMGVNEVAEMTDLTVDDVLRL